MRSYDSLKLNNSYSSILKVTLPLLLVFLSNYLTLSIDRMILAKISTDMMNAVSIAGNFICIFTSFFMELIEKNAIFVAQFYGDKQYDKISVSVWQMILFSIATIPLSWTIASFSQHINIFPQSLLIYGIPYQRIVFSCTFIYFIYISLSTFFIGQRKTYIVSLSVIIGCVFKMFFSLLLITVFNLDVRGAAYGTIIGYCAEVIFLSCIFFKKENRQCFNTLRPSFDFSLLKKVFQLGFPMGLLSSGAMVIWFIMQKFVSDISQEQLYIYNLLIILNLFFSYTANAMRQAISNMSANLIPNKDLKGIRTLLKRFTIINGVFFAVIFLLFLIFKNSIVDLVFKLNPEAKSNESLIWFCFYCIITYGSLEFLYKLLEGICLSGGDTKFVSRVNAVIYIFWDFLPIFALKCLGLLTSIKPIIIIFLFEPIPFLIIFLYRYKSLKWYNKIV